MLLMLHEREGVGSGEWGEGEIRLITPLDISDNFPVCICLGWILAFYRDKNEYVWKAVMMMCQLLLLYDSFRNKFRTVKLTSYSRKNRMLHARAHYIILYSLKRIAWQKSRTHHISDIQYNFPSLDH